MLENVGDRPAVLTSADFEVSFPRLRTILPRLL